MFDGPRQPVVSPPADRTEVLVSNANVQLQVRPFSTIKDQQFPLDLPNRSYSPRGISWLKNNEVRLSRPNERSAFAIDCGQAECEKMHKHQLSIRLPTDSGGGHGMQSSTPKGDLIFLLQLCTFSCCDNV